MTGKEFVFITASTAAGVAIGYLVARQIEATLLKRP